MHQKGFGGTLQFLADSLDSGLRLIGRVMSAETDTHVKTRPWRIYDVWKEYKYAQWTVMGRGGGDWVWLAGRANCTMHVGLLSLLILTCWERHSWELLLTFLLVTPADLCRGWGLVLPARSCHCCCYPNIAKLDCWYIHEVFSSELSCCYWPVNWNANFQTMQMRVALKNHI